jgi:hypothetical protein
VFLKYSVKINVSNNNRQNGLIIVEERIFILTLIFNSSIFKIGKEGKFMIMGKVIRLWALGTFILFMSISVAHSQQTFDITDSFFAKFTMLSESKELVIMSTETWGINTSNNENKALDNMTSHGMGVREFVNGKPQKSLSYTKFMDNDGDFFFVETIRGETVEGTCTLFGGTGKWKGIKGGGKTWITTQVKPQTPGTSQGRSRMTGTFELPK